MKTIKSLTSLILSITLCFLLGSIVANAAELPQYALHIGSGLTVMGTLIPKMNGVALMATPDTTALAAYAGKYEKKLFGALRNALDIANDITVLPGIKNKMRLTKLTVKDGVRVYRETFDAADDDLAYSGRDIETVLLKRDMLINPLKYRSTWMSEAMKPGVNVDDIPFAQFVNAAIMEKLAQEINDNSYLAVSGAGTSVATSFNGLGTILANEIIDAAIVPVATGAITNINAVAKFETMTKSMPVAYRRAGFIHYVSFDVFDKYNEDYRERYKKYTEANTAGEYFIDNTSRKVMIKPCTWMGTSQRIISTPKENLIMGVDGLGDMDKIITDVELELLKYRILFANGYQIRDLGALKVNDQA
jgi:hypothetical protein